MSRLEELKNLIKSEFPENWHEEYVFANKSEGYKRSNINVLSRIVTYQENFREYFFELLNFSAIEGEHISSFDLPQQLSNIKELLRAIAIPQAPQYMQGEVESRFSSFIGGLIGSLTFYELISSQIARNLKYSNKKYLFEQLDKYRNDFRREEDPSKLSQELAKAFFINMRSLRIDHMPHLERDVLEDLNTFSRILTDEEFIYKDLPYVKIILNRIHFLIRKMIYRYQEDETPLIYVIDSEETELSVENFPIAIFGDWDEKCRVHYEKHHNHIAKLKSEYEEINTIHPTGLNFSQYHIKTKYLKDISKQISTLERTVDNFKSNKLSDNSENLLDKAAANISANYLQNNVLSLKIEEGKGDIHESYETTINLQEETRVSNYFPHNKYLFWLSKNINEQFEEGAGVVNLANLQRDVVRYKEILDKFELALEWSDDHYFLAYQLPFHECVTIETLDEKEYSVFLASSFVLPIDYRKVRKDLAYHRKSLEQYKLLLEFNKDIQREREKLEAIRKETQDIKDDVKFTERRTIEVLGIFAALVIFAAGTINTLRFNYSPWVAFLFMFALGSSLSTFVAVIITVARGADHFKQNRSIYLTLSGIGVLCWVFLLVFGGDAEQKSPNQVQPQTTAPVTKDSLEQISEDGDSLRIRPVPDSIKR